MKSGTKAERSAPGQRRKADTPVRSEARLGSEALRAGVPALLANSEAVPLLITPDFGVCL